MAPPRKDLQVVRDDIERFINLRYNYEQILEQINELLLERGERSISKRTLERQLSAWGISYTLKAVHSLKLLYEEISKLFIQGDIVQSIHRTINESIQQHGQQPISQRALETQLQRWGLARQSHTQITDELVERVRYYFFSYGYSDAFLYPTWTDGISSSILQLSLFEVPLQPFVLLPERLLRLWPVLEILSMVAHPMLGLFLLIRYYNNNRVSNNATRKVKQDMYYIACIIYCPLDRLFIFYRIVNNA